MTRDPRGTTGPPVNHAGRSPARGSRELRWLQIPNHFVSAQALGVSTIEFNTVLIYTTGKSGAKSPVVVRAAHRGHAW